MLYQKKSGRAARLKYLLTLPLAGGLLCASTLAFTTKTYGVLDLTPKHIATANNAPATPKTSSEPSYPGGNEALYKYLKANINHAKVKEVDIENHLFMMFVVEKDGSLSNIKAFYSPKGDLTPETNSEISRVLSTSPKWIPGTRNGYAASVKHFVLFNFDKSATFKTVDNSNVTVLQSEKQTGPVFTAVDSQPSFPGGVDGFNKFLAKNIKYPKGAKDKGVSGKVFIQFIIEADGTLSDIKVKRDPGAGLGAEAARVLKLSPKWKPGMQNGKKVRVMYTVPVNFALDDNDKKAAIPLKGGPNVGNMYAAAPTNEADDAAGNTNELYKYIRDHVRYVTDAKNRNIQGRVFTSFTVNSNKKIQDIIVVRSPDKLLSDEVVRVLSAYNLTDGKANANYVLPVNFAISAGDNKWESKKAENAQPIANPYKPGSAETVNLNEIVVVTYPAK